MMMMIMQIMIKQNANRHIITNNDNNDNNENNEHNERNEHNDQHKPNNDNTWEI